MLLFSLVAGRAGSGVQHFVWFHLHLIYNVPINKCGWVENIVHTSLSACTPEKVRHMYFRRMSEASLGTKCHHEANMSWSKHINMKYDYENGR